VPITLIEANNKGDFSMEDGIKIDWNLKNSALYTTITLVGFGLIIGWFKLSVLWMSLAR
jgi:hypothetical protein